MRVAIYDRVEPPMPANLPLRLTQTCSQRSATAFLTLVVPVTCAAIIAALAVVAAILTPTARTFIGDHPVQGMEILAAVGFLVYLIALPTKRLIDRLATTRTVDIAHGVVTVTEGGYFRSWVWSAPLGSYAGVAHHVRASLSGTRHEIILVHPERAKSVLLSVAPRTLQSEVDGVAKMLDHQQIPPAELYRFKGLRPRVAATPLLDAAHA